MMPNAEQYLGGWYGAINFGIGSTVAWSSDAAQDVAAGQLQPLVRQLNGEDTVVNWLEPQEEMCHGVCDVLDDHGPNARLNFYRFLRPSTRRLRQWPSVGSSRGLSRHGRTFRFLNSPRLWVGTRRRSI